MTFDFEGPRATYEWLWPGQRCDNGVPCEHFHVPSTPLGGGLCFRAESTGQQCFYAHNLAMLPLLYQRGGGAVYDKYAAIACGVGK